jgi:hypothetical protein
MQGISIDLSNGGGGRNGEIMSKGFVRSVLLLACGALGIVSGAQAAGWPPNTSFCSDVPPGPNNKPALPCTLEKDLFAAIQGQATQWNWQGHIDADFSPSWDSGNFGSNNLPVLAAAIALWKPAGAPGFDAVMWWTTFLDCQIGNACGSNSDLKYLKGHEILSPIYESPPMVAVAAVNFWAATTTQGMSSGLGPKAVTYLKMSSALYALAAGTGPARTAQLTNFTLLSGGCSSCATTPNVYQAANTTINCNQGGNGNLLWNGPFLALAGARSQASSPCNSDSDPIMVRAIDWPGVTRSLETREQGDLLNFMEAHWPSGRTDNLYGNDSARRALLRNHINGSPYDPGTLTQILRNARFIREYRFLAWPGVRVTLLSSNPETCGFKAKCTAAMMAVKYTAATSEAQLLYPWPGDTRSCVTQGYAKLLPNNSLPTSLQARSADPAVETPLCEHGDTSLSMSLPAGAPTYQVIIGPTFDACVNCR